MCAIIKACFFLEFCHQSINKTIELFCLKLLFELEFFLKYCRVLSLEMKKKSSKKRCQPPKYCSPYSKGQKKNIGKRERKMKNEKKLNITINDFLRLLFYVEKLVLFENIIGKTLYCYICIKVFQSDRLLGMQ